MSRVVNTWSCANCGTSAFAEQNFCRKCGTPREARRQAPITEQVPVVGPAAGSDEPAKPFSRIGLALIALLFVVVGGLGALILNDILGDEPANPAEPPSTPAPASIIRGSASTTSTSSTTTSTAPKTSQTSASG